MVFPLKKIPLKKRKKRNKNMNMKFICEQTQSNLKAILIKELNKMGYNPISEDGFIFAQGTVPVALVAHMDTVHKSPPTVCMSNDGNILMSPQGIGGDDRCGIFMILKILQHQKCSVIFTEDEETGCVGAKKFIKTAYNPNANWIIEFDRKGNNDAVFYGCDNNDFTKFITDKKYGFKEERGSVSDISHIAPHLKIAAVNFSSGYFSPHSSSEYIVMSDVINNINRALQIIEDGSETKYEYVEKKYGGCTSAYTGGYSGYANGGYSSSYNDLYDEDYGWYYEEYYRRQANEKNAKNDPKDGSTTISPNVSSSRRKEVICSKCEKTISKKEEDIIVDFYGDIYCQECSEIYKEIGEFIYDYDCIDVEIINIEEFNIIQYDKIVTEDKYQYYIDKSSKVYVYHNDTAIIYPLVDGTEVLSKADNTIKFKFVEKNACCLCCMYYADIEDMMKHPKTKENIAIKMLPFTK